MTGGGKNLIYMLLCVALVSGHAAQSGVQDEKPSSEPPRPRIGLVLGGGGALGIAHVGVLKVLEEMRIPVDCLAGTSMGAIVGGLYAAGMSPADIECLLVNSDWRVLLEDKSPRRHLSFRRKEHDSQYLLDAEIGFRLPWRFLFPSGLASGQKLGLVMSRETAAVADIRDFDELPIPYRAVATDLKTGEAVWLDQGRLDLAMRASMAVPGIFTPITLQDRLLVDGGVTDNLPVAAVHAMGAEVVIAVDVTAAKAEDLKTGLSNFSRIVMQTYALMQRRFLAESSDDIDVLIMPDLVDYSAAGFHMAADIASLGENAARRSLTEPADLSLKPELYAEYLRLQRRSRPGKTFITNVRITGNELVDSRSVLAVIRVKPGRETDYDAIEADVARIHGLGDFEKVYYELLPTAEGHELVYKVREKEWGPGYLRFGLRLDSNFRDDSSWQVLMNYTRTQINRLGAEFSLDLDVGSDQRLEAEFFQPLRHGEDWFIAPRLVARSEQQPVYEDNRKQAVYDVYRLDGECTAGYTFGQQAEVRSGVMYGIGRARKDTGEPGFPSFREVIGGLIARGTIDTLDRTVLPEHGFLLTGDVFWSRRDFGAGESYGKTSAQYDHYATFGRHTLLLSFFGAASIDRDIPGYDRFRLGGLETMAGLSRDQLCGQYAGLGQFGYRYRLARLPPAFGGNFYLMARQDIGNAWNERADIALDDMRYSFAAGLAADTVIGPCGIGAAVADRGNYQLFVSVGTLF